MNTGHSIQTRIEHPYLLILLSLVVGFMIVKISYLDVRWIVAAVGGLLLMTGSVAASNTKHFFLGLFFLCLPISATNFLGTLDEFHYGGAPGLYHTIYDFFLVILYGLWISRVFITRQESVRFSGMDTCFWLIILMSLLSIYNAAAVHFSVYEIVRLAVMYLVFLYVANLKLRKEVVLAAGALLFGLMLESFLGLVQYATGGLGLSLLGEKSTMVTFNEVSRVGGTLGHPNGFARYLGFMIPLTVSLQMAPLGMKYKAGLAALFAVSTAALVMTLTRAAWGGLGISLAVIVILGVMARLISWRRAFVVTVFGVLVLGLVAFAFRDAIATRLFSYDHGSMSSRIPQIEIATNIIKEHPVIGVGINNYAEVMYLFDDTSERITSWFPNVVHNVYLLVASEMGIPALGFFLFFIFLFYKNGFFVIRRSDRFMKALGIGIMAGVTSFLIQILVMPPTLSSSSFLFFWVFAGLLTAMRYQLAEPGYAEERA